MIRRLWRRSFLHGIGVSVRSAREGARIHPLARIEVESFHVDRGTKVSERCVLTGDRIRLGERVWLNRDCEIDAAAEVSIGAGTSVQRGCTFNGNVVIGERCVVAPFVFASSGTHVVDRWPGVPIAEQERRAVDADGSLPDRPIVIGDDCWIGYGAFIAPGVRIGDGAVVGANSVVTRDVGAYDVVAGSPARVLRSLLPDVSGARTRPR